MNLTPDSFSDGGELPTREAIVARAQQLADDGADAFDLGGESTRPGAQPVSEDEQIKRTTPSIEAIRAAGVELPITIDTTRANVARAALDAGADAINDVSAATDDPAMLSLAAERQCGLILMHRLTRPERDVYSTEYEHDPDYTGGVVHAVRAALSEKVNRAVSASVERDAILVDPGLGFGKSVAQNAELLCAAGPLSDLGAGVLIGASRKSFLAAESGLPPAKRDEESVAATIVALSHGARCFRVHNVQTHRRALDAADHILGNNRPPPRG